MSEFDFKLEDLESRLRGSAGDPWRELILLARELILAKKELKAIRKKVDKVLGNE